MVYTCFDVPFLPTGDFIWEWAEYQTSLSVRYQANKKGMSSTIKGRIEKRDMMAALDSAFYIRASASLHSDYIRKYRDLFLAHLEDPGTFENFRFFDVPNSDEMIMFYLLIWTGRMGEAMSYLHFYGKDLKGEYRFSPKNESWFCMANNEPIAINERIKAKSVAKRIKDLGAKRICFFGGGSLPERLYDDCLAGTNVINFETANVDKDEILSFPSPVSAPSNLWILNDSLLSAGDYCGLFGKEDLVVMHGVSMYLGKDPENMITALINADCLLRHGGSMMFDYLLMTKGMMRTATAQHWPGASEMLIFETPEEAINQAKYVVSTVNKIEPTFVIDSIETTDNDKWGPTSVRVVLTKE